VREKVTLTPVLYSSHEQTLPFIEGVNTYLGWDTLPGNLGFIFELLTFSACHKALRSLGALPPGTTR